MKQIRQAVLLALIFLVVFLSHFISRNITSFDSAWSIHTAMSMIKEGNANLDEYSVPEEDYRIEKIHGHLYTMFPIGVSIIAVPFVYLMDKGLGPLLSIFPSLEKYIRNRSYASLNMITVITVYQGVELMIASFIIALTTVFIFLLSSLSLNKRGSLLMAFIFAFCTSSWSMASRGLWQHGPSVLLLTITLYLILLAKHKPWLVQFTGLPLAFAYVVRPTNSLSLFLLTVFVFLQYRKYFWRYLLWAALIILPFLMYNVSIYHSLLSPYYLPGRVGSTKHFFTALAGNLLSPARGLFIFSPIFLFSIYGVTLKIKNRQFDQLDFFLLSILFWHWMVISSFPHWWAGSSFGPRFFSDMIPYLIYYLIPAAIEISGARGVRKVVLGWFLFCFIVISIFIHYRGANSSMTYFWNVDPMKVDDHLERLWDWHDIQFLRGLR
jgi:hypothetical protein